jgi:hypothetical protein
MMDELELLKLEGGDPAPPSANARRAARGALEQAIESARARPAGVPPEHRRERRRAHPADVRPGHPRERRRARWGIRVGVVLAVGVLALALGAALRSGSSAGPPEAAAQVLDQLARVARAQPSETPGPGQYQYTATRSLTSATTGLAGGSVCNVTFSEYRQNWVAANGQGLFIETDGPAQYASAKDRANCRSAPEQGNAAATSYTWAAAGCLSIEPIPLRNLPTNPTLLRARLLTGKVEGGPPGAAEAFIQVADLLRNTNASPALRAALYRAAAGLPGVRFLGSATDELGRRGLALAIDSHGIRHELIFAPATSALLAEREIVTAARARSRERVGSVAEWAAYLPHRVVNSLPKPSPLPLHPACIRGGATVRSVPDHPQQAVLVGSAYLRLHPIAPR